MYNTVLKSIIAILISLIIIAGSVQVNAAADAAESSPAPAEPAPTVTEPAVAEPTVTEPTVTEPTMIDLIVTEPASEAASSPLQTASDDADNEQPDPAVTDTAVDPSPYGDVFSTEFIAEDDGAIPTSAASYTGIAIDGSYLDWDYYPHSAIQCAYEWAGSASGAIYNNGNGYAYGHTVTFAPAHQSQELGGMWQFCMSVNGTGHTDMTAALMYAGCDGRLHFAAEADYAANMNGIGGANRYYIVDTGYTGLTENITPDGLRAAGQLYGEAYVTRFPSRWDMEYVVDVGMLAEKAGLSGASDVRTISAQFNMLGNQWVTTAGTSTGAELGIILCIAAVCGTYLLKKHKLWGLNR